MNSCGSIASARDASRVSSHGSVPKNGEARESQHGFVEHFHAFPPELGRVHHDARDVATGMRDAGDEPLRTGSAASATTIGIVVVARFVAITGGVATVMIASGPSATSSAASLPNVWSNASSSAFVIALITVAIKNGVPNVRDRHLLGLFFGNP
jgi:hypothetical protein